MPASITAEKPTQKPKNRGRKHADYLPDRSREASYETTRLFCSRPCDPHARGDGAKQGRGRQRRSGGTWTGAVREITKRDSVRHLPQNGSNRDSGRTRSEGLLRCGRRTRYRTIHRNEYDCVRPAGEDLFGNIPRFGTKEGR